MTALLRRPLLRRLLLLASLPALLGGCAVVTVASTAVSVGAGAVGLAADAAIGTARITGKAVGAAADAVIPDSQ
ncbi:MULTISPECIES: hypothetical protein [Variovorax]|jgi:hypothetical protein|uniref:hypothetical protein n=1 Tax=Variovorax TaxID=34072 RepID=UPI000374604D|nr:MULTISPECIES: hypothetical protein [Variovorax]MBB3641062.1 hypothetical protein [Variovorax sp. BK613]RTD94327.1 hypothetical protein EJO68_11070 [Variovorax sp. 369]